MGKKILAVDDSASMRQMVKPFNPPQLLATVARVI
jgi:hypothetical protein